MNSIATKVLIGGASALAGGVVGFFISKKHYELKYEQLYNQRLDEEIRKIRADRRPLAQRIIQETTPAETIKRDSDEDISKNYTKYAQYYKVDPQTNEITMIPSVGRESDGDGTEPGRDPVGDILDEYRDVGPQLIPLNEYSALPPMFDFLTWTYFEEDDVLVDEKDSIVDDIEHTVGSEALCSFGEKAFDLSGGTDDNAVYVVNGDMMIAVEIVRVRGSYAEYNGL